MGALQEGGVPNSGSGPSSLSAFCGIALGPLLVFQPICRAIQREIPAIAKRPRVIPKNISWF